MAGSNPSIQEFSVRWGTPLLGQSFLGQRVLAQVALPEMIRKYIIYQERNEREQEKR